MAIKAILWDFAGVLLHTVEGDFNSLLAERLEVPITEIERVFNTEENNRWDLGELDDDTFFTFVIREMDLAEEKRATLAWFFEKDFYVSSRTAGIHPQNSQELHDDLADQFSHPSAYLFKNGLVRRRRLRRGDRLMRYKLIKPDPRMYQYALEKIGCGTDEVVFIDDRPINIQGAESLGIRSLLYRDTPGIIADLENILG